MIKNYNLNVTEVRDSDFKNDFPGIFDFTIGILSPTNHWSLNVSGLISVALKRQT